MDANLLDPENAPDLQELLDRNLEEVIQNSETYENVQVMTAKKKEHEELKRNANDLTQYLKKKAEKQREEFLKD